MRLVAALLVAGCGNASAPSPPVPVPVPPAPVPSVSPPPKPPAPTSSILFGDCETSATNPLRGEAVALDACVRDATQRFGSVTVNLIYDEAGKVSSATTTGIDEPTVRTCITTAAGRVARHDSAVVREQCAFAFGALDMATLPALDLTPTSTPATSAAAIAKLANPPLILLRPTDATSLVVLDQAMRTIGDVAGHYVLAARRGAAWKMVSHVELADVLSRSKDRLGVIVTPARTAVEVGCETHELARDALALDLVARKRDAGDRTTIAITPSSDLTYGDLVATIEAATSAGFTAWWLDRKYMVQWDGIDRFSPEPCGTPRGHASTVPSMSIQPPTVTDGLDKAIVRRKIKQNSNKLLYCYEKALLAKPELAGTVSATFTIEVTGKVSVATATGVAPDVSACVADVIRAIEFPAPKPSAAVRASIGFDFRRTGG